MTKEKKKEHPICKHCFNRGYGKGWAECAELVLEMCAKEMKK